MKYYMVWVSGDNRIVSPLRCVTKDNRVLAITESCLHWHPSCLTAEQVELRTSSEVCPLIRVTKKFAKKMFPHAFTKENEIK